MSGSRSPGSHARVLCSVVAGLALAVFVAPTLVAQTEAEDPMPAYQERRLEQRVLLEIFASPSLDGADLEVSAEDGTITLDGVVGSEQDRERAIHLARRTQGVRQVVDEMKVVPRAIEERQQPEAEDAALAESAALELAGVTFPGARARENWAFGWEVVGYSWEIDIDVDDGIATLSGEVPSRQDIAQAAEAVFEIPGIRAVRSELRPESPDGLDLPAYPGTRSLYWPWEGYPGRFSPYRNVTPMQPGDPDNPEPP